MASFVLALCGSLLSLFCSSAENPFYVAPQISYPDSLIAYPGIAIAALSPTLARNVEVDSYAVAPALPAGLSLDPATGVISGTAADSPSVGQHKVSAWNTWGKSNDEAVTVMVCPGRPQGLVGASPDGHRVQLSWTAVPGALSYAVLRASARSGAYTLAGTPGANVFDDHDSLLTPGATFYYFVRALNDSTYPSLPSDDTVAVTIALSPDTALPHAVVDAPAMARDSAVADTNTLAMSGTVDSDSGVYSVSMRLNGVPVAVALSGGQWSANPSGLLACQWNTLVITVRDNAQRIGVDTFWIYGRFGVAQPSPPRVDLRLCTALALRWSAVPGCSSYVVSRRRQGDATFVPLAVGLADTTFVDSGLNTGVLYEYVVQTRCERRDGSFVLRDTSAPSVASIDSTAVCFSKQYAGHNLWAVSRTGDGGYVATGSQGQGTARGICLVRTDRHGVPLWDSTYESGNSGDGYGVVAAQDGGYVLTGASSATACVLKVDAQGRTVWRRVLSTPNAVSGGRGVVGLAEGYAVAGFTMPSASSTWLWRLSASGDSLWRRSVGDSSWSKGGYALTSTADGGFLVVGYGNACLPLAKVSASGAVLSTSSVLPSVRGMGGLAVALMPDGGFAIAGTDSEGVIVKTSPSCVVDWVFRQKPDGSRFVSFWGLTAATSVGIAAVGTPVGGGQHLLCLSPSGSVLWDALVPNMALARSVIATPDGGFVLCGVTDIVKTDCRGNTVQ